MSNIILGAGDFAREVYEFHKFCGIRVDGFYDDFSRISSLRNKPVYNNLSEIKNIEKKRFIVGTGSPQINKKFLNLIIENDLCFSEALVCDSYIGENVFIGPGSVVCPKSVITCDIKIGKMCVINFSSTVGHDVIINNCVVLSPNVSISGRTMIEENVFFGTSALAGPKISICSNTTIGANSFVIRDINEPGLYVGSPAIRKINNDHD